MVVPSGCKKARKGAKRALPASVRTLRFEDGGLAVAILAHRHAAATALAEVTQDGTLRVSFQGRIDPHQLPRQGKAPVAVTLAGEIKTTDGAPPPQLRTITLAINRNGKLDHKGLPRCNYHQVQPASTAEAKAACRKSLIGHGSFEASVALPEQCPFPSDGTILAFNGNLHGKPVIYAHIYGTKPLPTSFTLPFHIRKGTGAYATTLVAELPQVAAEWGFVQGRLADPAAQLHLQGPPALLPLGRLPGPQGFPGGDLLLCPGRVRLRRREELELDADAELWSGGVSDGAPFGDFRLPRGKHNLPRELVAENQRWRLLGAASELFAEGGYASVSSGAVATRARVSKRTFYNHFRTIDECLWAAHSAAAEVVASSIAEACAEEAEGVGRVPKALDASLPLLAAEPALAHLLGAEAAAGNRAIARSRERLIDRLAIGVDRHRIAGAFGIVSDWVSGGASERLPDLAPELSTLVA